jgi:hypothetical protein
VGLLDGVHDGGEPGDGGDEPEDAPVVDGGEEDGSVLLSAVEHEASGLSGLNKLAQTNETVETLQGELAVLLPVLAEKSEATDKLVIQVSADQDAADKIKSSSIFCFSDRKQGGQ